MVMRRTLITAAIFGAALVALSLVTPTHGCGYGMPSPLARFALADCVVAGEIIQYEEDAVQAWPAAGAKQKSEYRVALIKVFQAVKGDEVTYIRLGLLPHQVIPIGYKGCFFLHDHGQEAFYVMQTTYDYSIGLENNPGFGKQMDQFQYWGRLMNDPIAGLQSKSPIDRMTTAALMISRYRTADPFGTNEAQAKPQPINATESRLILETLADADWNQPGLDFRVSAPRLFQQLGLKETDGWKNKPWKDTQEFTTTAKAWLKDNASSFRITTLAR